MATTTRLAILLLEVGQSSKETVIDNALNTIDAAIVALALNNALTGNNTFAGTSKFSGAVSGNGTGFPLKQVSVTFPSNADYTLISSEYESPLITINTTNIASPLNMIFPTTSGGFWVVTNNSGFAITCKTAAGTGIAIASNRRAIITGGGVNITRVTQDSVTTP